MEALAALGLACNVVQIVDFSIKTAEICKQIRDHGTSVHVRDLSDRVSRLQELSSLIGASLNESRPLLQNDQALANIATDCLRTSQDLQKQLEKLGQPKKEGFIATIRKTTKTVWRSSRIKDLQEKLAAQKSDLDTQILVSLRSDAKKYHDEDQEGFEALDEELKYFITRLATGFDKMSDLIRDENKQTRVQLKAQHADTRDRIEQRFEDLKISLSSSNNAADQRQAFNDSLIFPEMKLRELQIAEPHPDTCEWIFQEAGEKDPPWSNFIEWLTSSDQVYWICGKPASGKSVTMAFICSDARTKSFLGQVSQDMQLTPLVVDFFFWNAGNPMQKSATGFLQSVVHQILEAEPTLYDDLIAGHDELRTRSRKLAWSSRELEPILDSILGNLSRYSRGLTLFLDGLDEFDEGEEVLLDLVAIFRRYQHVKLCLSSRPSPRLHRYFRGSHMLQLQDLNHAGINAFVNQRLQDDLNLRSMLAESSREDATAMISALVTAITTKSDGVFLWAKLAVQSVRDGIENCDSFSTLYDRLNLLPKELDDLYECIWQNVIRARYLKEALLYFELILYKPLSLYQFFLATDPVMQELHTLEKDWCESDRLSHEYAKGRTRLLSICRGLLEVTADTSEGTSLPEGCERIDFMPKTARDYVFQKRSGAPAEYCESTDQLFLRLVKMECKMLTTWKPSMLTTWKPSMLTTWKPSMLAMAAVHRMANEDEYFSSRKLTRQSIFLALYILSGINDDKYGDHTEPGLGYIAEDLKGCLVECGYLDYVVQQVLDGEHSRPYLNYILSCALFTNNNLRHKEALERLLAAGADPIGNFRGLFGASDRLTRTYTPLQVCLGPLLMEESKSAKANGRANALKLLLQYSAQPHGSLVATCGTPDTTVKGTCFKSAYTEEQDVYVFMVPYLEIVRQVFGDEAWHRDFQDEVGTVTARRSPSIVLIRHASWDILTMQGSILHDYDQISPRFEFSMSDKWQELRELTAQVCTEPSTIGHVKSDTPTQIPGWGSQQLFGLLSKLGVRDEDPFDVIWTFGIPQAIFGDLNDDPDAASLWHFPGLESPKPRVTVEM